MANVYLGLPVGWSVAPGLLWTVINASHGKHNVIPKMFGASLACFSFNRLWAQAWNKRDELGLAYFAMAHADIKAEDNWLDTLIDELGRTQSDVMSTIVPINSEQGLTSTGIMDRRDQSVRRFTLTEAYGMPETFSIKDTCHPDRVLAINNGLFVCKLDNWFGRFPGFACEDRLVKAEDGSLTPYSLSEDWQWARWLHDWGLKVSVTRKVKVWHQGTMHFDNFSWEGTWDVDSEAAQLAGGLTNG